MAAVRGVRRARGRARELSAAVPAVYLVFFVAGPVDDALAAAVVARVRALADGRAWAGPRPGWFDDPDAPTAAERTTGGYLRTDELAGDDPGALVAAALALSAELGVGLELQFREAVLGRVSAGRPDPALAAALTGPAR